MVKHKRILLIIFAVLFLVVLFLIKDTSVFKKSINSVFNNQENGLTAMTLGELVYKDADGDGVADWEEPLYGLDPTKKETTPGTSDKVALNKLKAEQTEKGVTVNGVFTPTESENLTETEKFSRELFTTVATLNQNGTLDQTTINSLGASLAEKIQSPVVRKVYSTADIKIIKDDSMQAIKSYVQTMDKIEAKYPIKEDVTSILQKFIADGENVDSSVLIKLNEPINQTQKKINEILKINVPQSLVILHLNFLNAGERLEENVRDMQLFDSDPIVAMGAMSKYGENMDSFQSALLTLMNTIGKKLNN